MSDAAPPLPPPTSAWHMYRAMVGIGLVCGLLIVTAFVLTGPIISRNKAEALQRAILTVVPAAHTARTFQLDDDGRFQPVAKAAPGAQVVYGAYDAEGHLVGVAVEAQGMGYQDVIRVLYGYAPGRDAIVGLAVLDLRDTPGLGDKIEHDAQFLRNFEQLDVRLDADGAALAHPIKAVKPGAKHEAWQIDTITGATVTSSAVAGMLRDSAAVWIPRIRRNLADLERQE